MAGTGGGHFWAARQSSVEAKSYSLVGLLQHFPNIAERIIRASDGRLKESQVSFQLFLRLDVFHM